MFALGVKLTANLSPSFGLALTLGPATHSSAEVYGETLFDGLVASREVRMLVDVGETCIGGRRAVPPPAQSHPGAMSFDQRVK